MTAVVGVGDTGLGEVRGRAERHADQGMSSEEMIEDAEQIAALVRMPLFFFDKALILDRCRYGAF
jgi:hypothetical protein